MLLQHLHGAIGGRPVPQFEDDRPRGGIEADIDGEPVEDERGDDAGAALSGDAREKAGGERRGWRIELHGYPPLLPEPEVGRPGEESWRGEEEGVLPPGEVRHDEGTGSLPAEGGHEVAPHVGSVGWQVSGRKT